MSRAASVLVLALSALLAACGTDEIWACQESTTTTGFNGSTRSDCDLAWFCESDNGGMVLDIKCTNTGDSFKCDCLGNGQVRGGFSSPDVCDAANLAVQVNEGCNWKVPEDDQQVSTVE